jgi:hypothetical protein
MEYIKATQRGGTNSRQAQIALEADAPLNPQTNKPHNAELHNCTINVSLIFFFFFYGASARFRAMASPNFFLFRGFS